MQSQNYALSLKVSDRNSPFKAQSTVPKKQLDYGKLSFNVPIKPTQQVPKKPQSLLDSRDKNLCSSAPTRQLASSYPPNSWALAVRETRAEKNTGVLHQQSSSRPATTAAAHLLKQQQQQGAKDLPQALPQSQQNFKRPQPSPYPYQIRPQTNTTTSSSYGYVQSSNGALYQSNNFAVYGRIPEQQQSYQTPVPYQQQTNRNFIQYHNVACRPCIHVPTKKPQSFRDDPQKKAKVKSEMCKFYLRGEFCEFGSKCSFAHGAHELSVRTLHDLHEKNMENIEIYRTMPCFDWVCTGACPFGKNRCKSIHDPRARGEQPNWLPNKEMVDSNLDTDVSINNLHHLKTQEVNYGTPFGSTCHISQEQEILFGTKQNIKKTQNKDDQRDLGLYEKCMKLYDTVTSSRKIPDENCFPSETQRLQIALKMMNKRGVDTSPSSEQFYTYRDTHIIFFKMCMILQQRAFLINDDENIIELQYSKILHGQSISRYNNKKIVVCHEIAFAPVFDQSEKPPSFFFNIPLGEITECTIQQIKKRKRTKEKLLKERDLLLFKDPKSAKLDNFDSPKFQAFEVIRTLDDDANALILNMLMHRRSVLMKTKSKQVLDLEKLDIYRKFSSLHQFWEKWSWPLNNGRRVVTEKTLVPPVESQYEFATDVSTTSDNDIGSGQNKETELIWDGFLHHMKDETLQHSQKKTNKKKRLQVFRDITDEKEGEEVEVGPLPTLSKPQNTPASSVSSKSTRCWKSLLLSDGNCDDWQDAKRHYQKLASLH